MKHVLLFFLLLPITAHAYVVGSGSLDLGISKEDESENYGMAGGYSLNAAGVNYDLSLNSGLQVGSDRGRSVVATAAHDYQYEQSFVQHYGSHVYRFPSPYVSWLSHFSHRTEFEQESNSTGSDTDTDFENSDVNWTVSVGPRLSFAKGKWLAFETQAFLSRRSKAGEESNELDLWAGVAKSISAFSVISLGAGRVCSKDEAPAAKEECRDEYKGSMETTKKYVNLVLEGGVSKQDSTTTNIYSASLVYELNSAATINLKAFRSVKKISDLTEVELNENLSNQSTIQKGESLNYRYEWGRTSFELKARTYDTEYAGESSETKDAAAFYSYQLSSTTCLSCMVEMGYEYSDYGNDKEQTIESFTIKKNHSRRFSSAISFRKTVVKPEIDLWSVSLLLSYNGLSTKLGMR